MKNPNRESLLNNSIDNNNNNNKKQIVLNFYEKGLYMKQYYVLINFKNVFSCKKWKEVVVKGTTIARDN